MGRRINIVMFTMVSVGFVFFVLLFISCLIFRNDRGNKENHELATSIYQSLTVNPRTNEYSKGFVTTHRKLEDDEYLYYTDFVGNVNLISEFGSTEYICEGSCSCVKNDEDDQRRTSTSTTQAISKTFSFLVAAITPFLAYEKAKDFFGDKCTEEIGSHCSSEIDSTIDCDHFVDPYEDENTILDDDLSLPFKFFCKGECLDKKLKSQRAKDMQERFDCSRYSKAEEINVDIDIEDESLGGSVNKKARKAFQTNVMIPYCKEKSTTEYYAAYGSSEIYRWRKITFCVGGGNTENKKIHCRQTYPPTSNRYGDPMKTVSKHWIWDDGDEEEVKSQPWLENQIVKGLIEDGLLPPGADFSDVDKLLEDDDEDI